VFERNQLRNVPAERDRQIERLKTELEAEKKAYREVERSQGDAPTDIKSLHRRLDIAKKDAADAESRLGIAMESLSQLTKEKDEWKRTQRKWTADMENCRKTMISYERLRRSATRKFKLYAQLRRKRSTQWLPYKRNGQQ
jgi:chromosome segregation ATPase